SRTPRARIAVGFSRRRCRCARAVDQRRSRRRDTALRGSSEAAQPTRCRRYPAAAPGNERMTFLWPHLLWLLLVTPLVVAAYIWVLRRKKEAAVKYASLTMIKDAMSAGQSFRRHVPPTLFLLALITMIVAIARPAAVISLPSQHETVILAIDVS